jgi:hypothetical protein
MKLKLIKICAALGILGILSILGIFAGCSEKLLIAPRTGGLPPRYEMDKK